MQSRSLRFVLIQLAMLVGMLAGALLLPGCGSSGTATPVIRPASGTYTYIPTLTITDATPGVAFYYTTDGSTPTVNSHLYSSSSPIAVSQSETVNVIAVDPTGNGPSAVASANYTINLPPAATPVLTPAAGAYTAGQSVTITDATPGVSIYYTTNGTTPTNASTLYTGTPIVVSSNETLNAVAISQSYGYGYSAVGGGAYVILVQPTFSEGTATYTTAQQITLADTTAGASIYYTTNGTTPTTSSTLYTGTINVPSTETVTAIAAAAVPGGGTLTTTPVSATYIIHPPGTSLVLSGTALNGQPVAGASVQLYATGATGYSSAATPLLTSPLTTDSTGAFSLTGKYTCTPGTYLYLTASGGATAAGKGANPNLTLAALGGLCSNPTIAPSFTLNEETTVATAYALAHFSNGTSFGNTQLSQPGSGSSAPADNFATSSTNAVGLANAMAIGQILVSGTSGSSPGNNSNASATPEWWQINLIADMLSACVNSTGGSAGSSTPCGTLFSNVGGTAPADTLQAALDLALNPVVSSTKIANLYALIPASAPYTPYPASAAAVTDFSVGVQYAPVSGPTPLLSQPQAVAIDSLGNAWVGNQPTGSSPPYQASLVELTPTGVPIQAGATSSNYAINTYALAGASTALGSQYDGTTIAGLFAPSIDTNNNVWITDRQKSNMAMVTGSGTTYSTSYSYQNGGNALDSGGKGAAGYALNASSFPTSVYLDGSNNVWFMMEGSAQNGGCAALGATLASSPTTNTAGLAAFLDENPLNMAISKDGNTIGSKNAAFLTVDPGKNDTVTISGTPTPISGSPFVWFAGVNSGVNLLIPGFTQAVGTATPNGGVPYPSCELSSGGTGESDDTAAGETYWTLSTTAGNATNGETAHSQSWVPDIADPNLTGDYLHDIGVVQDMTWDKAGNLWVANGYLSSFSNDITPINTIGTTANQINAAISKITPNWGTGQTITSGTTTGYTPTAGVLSNFTYSVFHNQSGLFDGSAVTNVPNYITTDGGGNVYFTMSTDNYVNAITNSGTALTQVSGTASSPTTGFIGSVCASCTYNGTKATYQRANSYTLSRPAIDQSGNIWVPLQGSGSTSLYLLVGAAVPRVQPDSVGLASGTFASQP